MKNQDIVLFNSKMDPVGFFKVYLFILHRVSARVSWGREAEREGGRKSQSRLLTDYGARYGA